MGILFSRSSLSNIRALYNSFSLAFGQRVLTSLFSFCFQLSISYSFFAFSMLKIYVHTVLLQLRIVFYAWHRVYGCVLFDRCGPFPRIMAQLLYLFIFFSLMADVAGAYYHPILFSSAWRLEANIFYFNLLLRRQHNTIQYKNKTGIRLGRVRQHWLVLNFISCLNGTQINCLSSNCGH